MLLKKKDGPAAHDPIVTHFQMAVLQTHRRMKSPSPPSRRKKHQRDTVLTPLPHPLKAGVSHRTSGTNLAWRSSIGLTVKSLALTNRSRPQSSGTITHEFAQREAIRSFPAWRSELLLRGVYGSSKQQQKASHLESPAAPAHFTTFTQLAESFSLTRVSSQLLQGPSLLRSDYRQRKSTIAARFPES